VTKAKLAHDDDHIFSLFGYYFDYEEGFGRDIDLLDTLYSLEDDEEEDEEDDEDTKTAAADGKQQEEKPKSLKQCFNPVDALAVRQLSILTCLSRLIDVYDAMWNGNEAPTTAQKEAKVLDATTNAAEIKTQREAQRTALGATGKAQIEACDASFANGTCIECSEPSTLQCSGCNRVKYCSRAHQISNWKSGGHKVLCKMPVFNKRLGDADSLAAANALTKKKLLKKKLMQARKKAKLGGEHSIKKM
jgi:hypothetical protein